MSAEILVGDCRKSLRSLPEKSVQTCVTSPPYFGLRDYGTGEWEGGDPACDHSHAPTRTIGNAPSSKSTLTTNNGAGPRPGDKFHADQRRDVATACPCGARRVDRQIGLEPSPDEFVAALVDVFREVRRVLRDDGTVWLNLGDSYNAYNGNRGASPSISGRVDDARNVPGRGLTFSGAKNKDLIGIPWLVAFALRADGWWLRSEIIWAKPNPMPESVTDRPTRAHEQVFLLSKSARYFYDADAVREEHVTADDARNRDDYEPRRLEADDSIINGGARRTTRGAATWPEAGRNKRSVWAVATQPYAGAHFATFPPKLIEPCILAGSPPKCCGMCGAPWERITEGGKGTYEQRKALGYDKPQNMVPGVHPGHHNGIHPPGMSHDVTPSPSRTVGWRSTCEHDDDTGRSIVLDPFAGSGTVGVVCGWHGRDFIGCELNPAYAQMARERIASEGRLGRRAYSPPPLPDDHVPLFDLKSLA